MHGKRDLIWYGCHGASPCSSWPHAVLDFSHFLQSHPIYSTNFVSLSSKDISIRELRQNDRRNRPLPHFCGESESYSRVLDFGDVRVFTGISSKHSDYRFKSPNLLHGLIEPLYAQSPHSDYTHNAECLVERPMASDMLPATCPATSALCPRSYSRSSIQARHKPRSLMFKSPMSTHSRTKYGMSHLIILITSDMLPATRSIIVNKLLHSLPI